jgi:undecaprenyl diphosphate synthase
MNAPRTPRHVAIIMDGNGRWAERRGLPRLYGHERGADAVRRTVTAARKLGLRALTLYAFSEQNWGRPVREVQHLMSLMGAYLRRERQELRQNGVRLRLMGDRARLPPEVRCELDATEAATAGNTEMVLTLAVSYGAREDLVLAARTLAAAVQRGQLALDGISEASLGAALATRELPPVDLVVRTSGEHRLSNFLLWEAAYAELFFTPVLWPDFGEEMLRTALDAYSMRQRRFGLVVERAG